MTHYKRCKSVVVDMPLAEYEIASSCWVRYCLGCGGGVEVTTIRWALLFVVLLA